MICRIGDLVTLNPESIKKNNNYDTINYLDTANLTKNVVSEIVQLKISEAPSRAKRIIKKGDILYSTVRPNLCHYGIVEKNYDNLICSTGFAVLRANKNVNPYYLYSYLTLPIITEKLHSIAENSTSAYPSIKPDDIDNLEINIPSIEVQNKIASILQKIEHKMDLNNQINNNLLEVIDTLYKNTFYDINNYDKAENIADITIGKTPPRNEKECFTTNETDMKWVSISDLGKGGTYIFNTSEKLTLESVEKYNIKIIPKNTIILSFKLTVGRIAITTENMTTNEAIAHFNLKNEDMRYFLYSYLKNFDYTKLGSTSSIATAVNSKIIKSMPIALPDKEVLKDYNQKVIAMFEKIFENEKENQTLDQLRDTLLPKLMNGEIDLESVEV